MFKYSHYLAFLSGDRDPASFRDFVEDVKKIIENAPANADLCGAHPKEPPYVKDDGVIIGSARNTSPFSRLKIMFHEETIKNRYPMSIIRTNDHPYDPVICACILSFVHHFPSSEATSDGGKEQWKQGIALYEYSTERKAPNIHLR
jgi:hypothetical protein